MTIDEAMAGLRRLFLDSAPVIYYVEGHPDYLQVVTPFFDAIDAGTLVAVASPITLAVCLVGVYRSGAAELEGPFLGLLTREPNADFVIADAGLAVRAAQIRARYNHSLPDAFQVATALAARCDVILTNDRALRRVTALSVIVVDDLE